LSFVVGNAYRGMLRRGTYPLAVLHIRLPADAVDVNVHPRKDEVRFRDARTMQETVSVALQRALASRYAVPQIPLETGEPSGSSPAATSGGVAERPVLDLRRGLTSDPVERVGLGRPPTSDRRIVGQMRDTYLLVEAPDGLEIVDQHVAHEQVLHAALRAQYESGDVPRQTFLLPVRIELPFDEAERLEGHRDALTRLGVVLDAFGGGTFLLREYPAALVEHQARYGFQEAIEAMVAAMEAGVSARDPLQARLLASLACAAAVVAGTPLSAGEQQDLVDRLMRLDDPYRCPHGRPIVIRIDEGELQRRFGRR
jgi:DNA mismatch repair protein MutL